MEGSTLLHSPQNTRKSLLLPLSTERSERRLSKNSYDDYSSLSLCAPRGAGEPLQNRPSGALPEQHQACAAMRGGPAPCKKAGSGRPHWPPPPQEAKPQTAPVGSSARTRVPAGGAHAPSLAVSGEGLVALLFWLPGALMLAVSRSTISLRSGK